MCEYCYDYTPDVEEATEEEERIADNRVKAGIEWLDVNVGLFWRRLVKVGELDINSLTCCVLGQVFAEYAKNPKYTYDSAWGLASGLSEFYSGYDYATHHWQDVLLTEENGFSARDISVSTLNDAWQRALRAS
jgi:hypothetical protein